MKTEDVLTYAPSGVPANLVPRYLHCYCRVLDQTQGCLYDSGYHHITASTATHAVGANTRHTPTAVEILPPKGPQYRRMQAGREE